MHVYIQTYAYINDQSMRLLWQYAFICIYAYTYMYMHMYMDMYMHMYMYEHICMYVVEHVFCYSHPQLFIPFDHYFTHRWSLLLFRWSPS